MQLTPRQAIDIPPVWLIGFACLAWVQARLLDMGLSIAFWGLSLIAIALAGIGLVLTVLATDQFRRHRTSVVPHQMPDALITTGVYARSRNPIYLGDVLILLGAVLWFDAVLSLLLVPLFVWVITWRFIRPEEARLRRVFGAKFDAYAEKTPRWL